MPDSFFPTNGANPYGALTSPQRELSPAEQTRLGQPLADDTDYSPEDHAFLEMLVQKVDAGEVKLFVPSSLINQALYETLPPEKQSKVEFQAMNMLTKIREIHSLFKAHPEPTFQLQNMVMALKQNKEQLEAISGDLFVI